MDATEPLAGFDIHNFFNKAPPSPYPHPHASHLSCPPNQLSQNAGSFPTNPGSLPSMPPQNFQYNIVQQQQQGQPQVFHPYMHYQQEHTLRPPSFTAAPINQHQQSPLLQFPASSAFNSLQPNPSLSYLPFSSSPQASGGPNQSSTSPLDGARLMALLTTNIGAEASGSDEGSFHSGSHQGAGDRPCPAQGISQDLCPPSPALAPAMPTVSSAPVTRGNSPGTVRSSSGKQPRGRLLWGDHVIYNVDVREPGEAQPQLEVNPITVYGSDPVLVVGRQIAVNKRYICYGLRQGTIRILNINTALRALLRGHTQRVTDMVFLSEEQHLLASASIDGRIYVRRILEGPCEGGKVLITEQILLAIQIVGDWEFCHPRVCWNLQMPNILEVAIGKVVLSIDVLKVQQAAPQGGFLGDHPLKCPMDSPLEGVSVVGAHNGIVTDLAVPAYSKIKVASASQDGTMRIWGDGNLNPLSSILPHVGEAVAAVAFMSAPRRPDHFVLLTAGPLNRELKLWAPTEFPEEPSSKLEAGTWRCLQTLEFQSSDALDGNYENAIFNQMVVAPRASLILLANAKKNAIYAVHVEFGHNTTTARMNYLAEFSVAMPILSLTVTEEAVTEAGEGKVQIYCVQTQAIQQYGLDVSQCLPPLDEAVSEAIVPPERTVLSAAPESGRSADDVLDLIDMGPVPKSGTSNLTHLNVAVKTPAISSAFGSPIEVGQLEVLTAHHGKRFAMDLVTSSQAPENMQNSAQVLPQSHISEVVLPASNRKPSSRRRSCSRSPTRNSDGHHDSIGSKSGDDILEMRPSSSLRPLLNVTNQDRSYISSITVAEELLDRQEDLSAKCGSSKASAQQCGEIQCPHLITPSELMDLAASSKHAEAVSASPSVSCQEQLTVHAKTLALKCTGTTDGFIAVSPSVDLEKNVINAESLVVGDDMKGKNALVSTLIESFEATQFGNKYVYEESLLLPELDRTSGDIADPSPGAKTQIDEGEVPGRRDRSLVISGDVNNNLGFRHGSGDFSLPPLQAAIAKGRKNKNKTNSGGIGSSPLPLNLSASGSNPEGDTSNVHPVSLSMPESAPAPAPASLDPAFLAQMSSMQESLNQLVIMQKEIQKQMTVMVAVPVVKEGKRMEGALGQRMEKVLKAHVDAMWARLAEESAQREKQERERVQQVTMLLTNFVSKDMPVALERGFKKEFAAIGPVVAQAVLPPLHKAVSTTVAESFQGFTEKMLPQLEKSVSAKLEGTVTRQIQTQFQTIGRQVLQETLRTCFESSVLPAFERTCRSMFDHVESSFQHGMAEHTQHAQEQLLSSHSDLASALKETLLSATMISESLKGELADGQRKLLTLAENASANAARRVSANNQINSGLPDKVLSLQHLEESLDPTIELSRLLKEGKLEEAFNKALSLSDVAVVSWLCMQIKETQLFSTVPLPLSQGVLLSLVQQLGCDLGKETARKLSWIREAALALNPDDPLLAPHMRPFLEQLYQNLHQQSTQAVPGELADLKLVMHVVRSLLTSCK